MTVYWTLLSLGVAALCTQLLMPITLRTAQKHQLVDRPGRHKRHGRDVPLLGGLLLFVSMWSSVLIAYLVFPELFAQIEEFLIYIFAGALIITLVGFADDLLPLSASTKLAAQLAVGLILCLGGLRVDPLTLPLVGALELGNWSIVITLIWVILLTNAINLIDGLDGLASGVSLIAAASLVSVGLIYQVEGAVIFGYSLIGFLIVFLFYNRYPARIFLGDSGALQIGYYFAVMSLLVPIRSITTTALYLPLLTLGVPIIEALISISRRLVTRRNILKADRRHLFHYLAAAGLSPRGIVLAFYAVSAGFGVIAVAMRFLDRVTVLTILALFMVVVFGLFFIFMATSERAVRGRNGLNSKELGQDRRNG